MGFFTTTNECVDTTAKVSYVSNNNRGFATFAVATVSALTMFGGGLLHVGMVCGAKAAAASTLGTIISTTPTVGLLIPAAPALGIAIVAIGGAGLILSALSLFW